MLYDGDYVPCLRTFQPFIVEGGMRNQVLAGTLRVLYSYGVAPPQPSAAATVRTRRQARARAHTRAGRAIARPADRQQTSKRTNKRWAGSGSMD